MNRRSFFGWLAATVAALWVKPAPAPAKSVLVKPIFEHVPELNDYRYAGLVTFERRKEWSLGPKGKTILTTSGSLEAYSPEVAARQFGRVCQEEKQPAGFLRSTQISRSLCMKKFSFRFVDTEVLFPKA